MNEKQTKMLEKGEFAEYSGCHKDSSEGHIFLAKEGACTITLSGAASMYSIVKLCFVASLMILSFSSLLIFVMV